MKALPLICAWLLTLAAYGQTENQIDLTEFTRDTQQWIKKDNNTTLVWWIPTEYWRLATKGNSMVTEEAIKQIEDTFSPYVLVCAADLSSNVAGVIKTSPEAELREKITFIDKNGKKYKPLEKDEVSEEAFTIANYMKPVLGQALGKIGEGMHFYFFKVKDDKGEDLIQATKEGAFNIVIDEKQDFKWTLPIPTLMPPKFCPVDKEKMKGHWKFCPIHGNKLN
jgi:hypothetical protein